MKKLLQSCLLLLMPLGVFASAGMELDSAGIDLTDKTSLENGAHLYVQYCLGCHSTKYIRYLNLADDFDIDEQEILNKVAPEGAGIYDKMLTAMNEHDAKKWFGTQPPDLSLIARSRGADWLYSYLKGFYADPKKPLGVNNAIFPDVGMPNPLWKLQGTQRPVYETVDGQEVITELELEENGTMSADEFDKSVNDIVNFLVYAGEPAQLKRESMGKYVLFFIFMFGVIAYLLKKEYWKDIH
ncbi:ubiquinol-cytochrome c reductase cytochrome c1 subunit [Bathymodiolus platifrons methanotrophic gill symbiont]|uniref:cytochrome c1 n=1 Tax=Bathymodiolus platifrons methanotrophic gill symbiont TaxID=113268 RepID=UPI000B418E6B|nr:cytochrome c1 [Bathymodiolus platifrons methanotrophic gill symbiont]TXK96874.1 cytochrome c1 [Methylococcaceae bacterium CS4]TXK98697.1 cytochrome c1 [Methylococcaceae bacterium CS5]TXL05151.1 cytochrome c1 [Methylococcaceae bacterium CS1]TXL07367.1 cytochrome c1 [Methylococcaceae bacterium CS3]TXL09896.1 cytochrome c1 [Methylococcaceae bacterium CS2]TXL13815.1 cytochrome c1 [Methylococcaceae bacterium HT4]TXL19334.1 cytochrome c1 [Methylococcaceae bacterium HT5]